MLWILNKSAVWQRLVLPAQLLHPTDRHTGNRDKFLTLLPPEQRSCLNGQCQWDATQDPTQGLRMWLILCRKSGICAVSIQQQTHPTSSHAKGTAITQWHAHYLPTSHLIRLAISFGDPAQLFSPTFQPKFLQNAVQICRKPKILTGQWLHKHSVKFSQSLVFVCFALISNIPASACFLPYTLLLFPHTRSTIINSFTSHHITSHTSAHSIAHVIFWHIYINIYIYI